MTMTLDDLYRFQTSDGMLDLRELAPDRLRACYDESAAHGDLHCVAVIETLLAGEEPVYLGGNVLEEIRARLGDECNEIDAERFKWRLVDLEHFTPSGWLVITEARWDELALDAADIAEAAR